jgi:hypothetical protein
MIPVIVSIILFLNHVNRGFHGRERERETSLLSGSYSHVVWGMETNISEAVLPPLSGLKCMVKKT